MLLKLDVTMLAVLAMLFIIWPFGAFLLCFFLLSKLEGSRNRAVFICVFIISLYWGLLAFTQKSLAVGDTDCITYYNNLTVFEGVPAYRVFEYIDIFGLLNFIFYPASAFFVALTGNVQTASFLWVFVSYACFYYCIFLFLRISDCYSNKFYFLILLISSFCFAVFVQISELLKNASAFSVFFVAFTLYFKKGWNYKTVILLLLSLGLHPSVIMLSPLYLYKCFSTRFLILFSVIVFPLSTLFNIFDCLINYIPGGSYFELLSNRIDTSFESAGSLHYVLKMLLLFFMSLGVWFKFGKKDNYVSNVAFLYFILASLNYINLVAYLRFALFSHFIMAFLLIEYYRINSKKFDFAIILLVFLFFTLSLRYTIGRLTPGGYTSSYMDNSVSKMIFSSTFDYLNVDYEK